MWRHSQIQIQVLLLAYANEYAANSGILDAFSSSFGGHPLLANRWIYFFGA